MRSWLAVAVALAAGFASPAAGRPGPSPPAVERLGDGMELVVVPVPDAPVTSIRYVVRAGAADDPPGKAGLAHLLEHVVLHSDGSPDGLGARVRAAGGDLNGWTTASYTMFSLDAPSQAFTSLAERLLQAITDPAFGRASVDVEQQVVLSESEYRQGGETLSLVEAAIFGPLSTVLGSRRTRSAIERQDLVDFFVRFYAAANTRVVVVGDVTQEAARELLGRSIRLPPSLPAEAIAPRAPAPGLPRTEKGRAPITALVLGYAVDEADRQACNHAAELLSFRLMLALEVREPLVSRVEVACGSLRGTPFLLALAFTRARDVADLPERLERAFADLGRQPATRREALLMAQRAEGVRRKLLANPVALAQHLAEELGQPSARPPDFGWLDPPAAALRRVPKLARDNFTPQRRVSFYFSPFEGG